jgi:transcriptional regulator with GAF, ATPase, and Fis domain
VTLEPMPATVEAFEKLGRLGNEDVGEQLQQVAAALGTIVPQCVGMSLTLVDDDITLTLATSSIQALPLDAVQYLDGGPCLDAVEQAERLIVDDIGSDSEQQWSLFARASAMVGVRSSLSLPLLDGDRVLGGFNLYASEADAFEGHVEELARLLGAWGPGAVRDADLTFSSRLRAGEAPAALARQADLDTAVALIAEKERIERGAAAQRLYDAAARAGLPAEDLARTVIRSMLG